MSHATYRRIWIMPHAHTVAHARFASTLIVINAYEGAVHLFPCNESSSSSGSLLSGPVRISAWRKCQPQHHFYMYSKRLTQFWMYSKRLTQFWIHIRNIQRGSHKMKSSILLVRQPSDPPEFSNEHRVYMWCYFGNTSNSSSNSNRSNRFSSNSSGSSSSGSR